MGHHIPQERLVYVATDEKKKDFFDAFKTKWAKVKFLDDYFEYAGLKDINPNYLGMIDAIVCTRAEEFTGTWFSTFTGYITRMRGYMGYPDNTTWFGDKEHRDHFQGDLPRFYMRENSISWFGIDEDTKDYWPQYSRRTLSSTIPTLGEEEQGKNEPKAAKIRPRPRRRPRQNPRRKGPRIRRKKRKMVICLFQNV